MAELKHPIREAERYLQNARQILSEKADNVLILKTIRRQLQNVTIKCQNLYFTPMKVCIKF
jgi:hypothetical protein